MKSLEERKRCCSDISHSFNLICKYAIQKLPSEIIGLIRQISSHFGRSALRRAKLKLCQKTIAEKDFDDFKQVLSYVPTRWTSLVRAAERVLFLWEPLKLYYHQHQNEILPVELSPRNMVYLELLVCLVGKLNAHIETFERPDLNYSSILPKIRT